MLRRLALIVTVLCGLSATALPARAGVMEWKDPAGDASVLGETAPVAGPDEANFDILRVVMHSDGTTLTWTAFVKKLAASPPPGGTGQGFRFAFHYQGIDLFFRVLEDTAAGRTTTMRVSAPPAPAATVPCRNCVSNIDRKTNTVVMKAPIASIADGVRAANAKAPKVAAGSVLESLVVEGARSYYLGAAITYQNSDESSPPPDTKFTL